MSIMSGQFDQYLRRLDLTPGEAAQLLGVSARTVRRWQDGAAIPGPAQQAILAWIRLHERHLPWRPDSVSIEKDNQEQIARHRRHTIDLDAVLERVDGRGGAKAPWVVEWDIGRASLGTMQVSFYKLQSGSFSLGSYRRTDIPPDTVRDMPMIEDAIYCIAKALEKKSPEYGPVTLVVHHGSPKSGRGASQRLTEFPTANSAVASVCERMGSPGYEEPFIMTKTGDLLWDTRELERECIRRREGPRALAALADYLRTNANVFFQDGARGIGSSERSRRENQIRALADAANDLAKAAGGGSVQYQDFEDILGLLHATGFFPPNDLISDVAMALEGVKHQQ
jgi:hypothetical protein